MTTKPSPLFIICLLGALDVISPFAIDMYLPAFGEVGREFGVSQAVVSLSLSSYFIGLAVGQLFYGPLLDRFGRKKPLYAGLGLFILASIACACAPSIEWLIGLRVVQAIGGCAAGVGALAMVMDFFGPKDSARILSRLFLFIALSPMLAPTIGGAIAIAFGWKAVFLILAAIVAAILLLTYFLLPEGHVPDASISLKPGPIIAEYLSILKHPRFFTYGMAGAFAFGGLFTYVAGAPILFMDGFGLSPEQFSMVFAGLAVGFIGASQLNVLFLKRWSSERVFFVALATQVVVGIIFAGGAAVGLYGLTGTLVLLFLFLACAGLSFPNGAALALSPFTKNAGSASALLGFLQLAAGSIVSTFIGVMDLPGTLPIIVILGLTSVMGFATLALGRKRAEAAPVTE